MNIKILLDNLSQSERGQVYTPFDCVDEMINIMPINWSDWTLRFCFPWSKRAEFALAVKDKLIHARIDEHHIIENMLFLFDDEPIHHKFAKRVLDPYNKYKINIQRMEDADSMEFNYGFTNPPYQDSAGQAIWPKFFMKLHNMVTDGYGIIVPNRLGGSQPNIGNERVFDTIKRNLVVANIGECSRHFPGVGKGTDYFSYYIADKRQESNSCHFISRVDDFHQDPTIIDIYPTNTLTSLDISIFNKIRKYPTQFRFKRKDNVYVSDGNKRFLIKNPPHAVYNKCYKHFDDGRLSDNEELASIFVTYQPINDATPESAFAIFNGKLVNYYIEKNLINSIQIAWLNDLPRFDLSRPPMSDEDQCFEIGLTLEETEYVLNYSKNVNQQEKQILETDKSDTIRTDERIKQTGEVFTPAELAEEIESQFSKEAWEQDKTFIDPSAGNGNLLITILKRKLKEGHDADDAIKAIYGVDLMPDNIRECKDRMIREAGDTPSIRKTLDKNIKSGDALNFCYHTLGNDPMLEF